MFRLKHQLNVNMPCLAHQVGILNRLNCKKGAVEPCESNFEDHIDKLEVG